MLKIMLTGLRGPGARMLNLTCVVDATLFYNRPSSMVTSTCSDLLGLLYPCRVGKNTPVALINGWEDRDGSADVTTRTALSRHSATPATMHFAALATHQLFKQCR